MKKFLIMILILNFTIPVFAGSVDPVVYRTMQRQSYRNNYRNQAYNRPMPYWQAQSNYMTRNRNYADYQSYNNYSNSMRQYNSQFYRGRY
ncbi:hypothetical protein IKQ21_08355 [bacterium]|nr:hypothetical protein [bacterium]